MKISNIILILIIISLVLVGVISAAPSALYAIKNPFQLTTINTKTGKLTPVGPVYPGLDIFHGESAIDPINKLLYVLYCNRTDRTTYVTGLNLDTGETGVRYKTPFPEQTIPGLGQTIDVDPITGEIYITGQIVYTNMYLNELDASTVDHQIYKISPPDPICKLIQTLDYHNSLGGGGHAFDTSNGLLWLSVNSNDSGILIYQMDVIKVSDGMVVHELKENIYKCMVYDFKEKSLYSLAEDYTESYHGFNFGTIDMTANPPSFNRISRLHDYAIIVAGVAAIDPIKHVFYALAMKTFMKDPPIYLITIDCMSGQVIDEVYVGDHHAAPIDINYGGY